MISQWNIFIQTGKFINVINCSYRAQAAIYNEDQREQINRLIRHNFLPHHTAIAYGIRSSESHWRLEKYRGRLGVGFKLITSSYVSRNARHVTYFLKDGIMIRPVKKEKRPDRRMVLGNPNLTDELFAIIDDRLAWQALKRRVKYLLRKQIWIDEIFTYDSPPSEEMLYHFRRLDAILEEDNKRFLKDADKNMLKYSESLSLY